MSPIKQVLAGRSTHTSPASTSAPTADPSQPLDDFRTKTEQAIKGLQDLTERQGQRLDCQGRLLLKYLHLDIRILRDDGRKAICKLLKADYEVAKQNWASFLQSLSVEEKASLQLSRFSQQAIQATLYGKFQKQGGSTAHSSTPDVVAAAVANLPESARKAYILLFDAIHGKGAFDKEEVQAWNNPDL
ncbi:hypothetical protein ABBQ38_005782 [Trebouxia sp. C0009 RCD-2024]